MEGQNNPGNNGEEQPTLVQRGNAGLTEAQDLVTRSEALVRLVREKTVPHGTATIEMARNNQADDDNDDDASEFSAPDELEDDLATVGRSVQALHSAMVDMRDNLELLTTALRSDTWLMGLEERRLARIDRLRDMQD